MAIERLSFSSGAKYNAIEASSHLARYFCAKPFCGGANVLDVACGEGYGSHLMATQWDANHVVGVDVSEVAIESAQENFQAPNIDFLVMSASDLESRFKPGDFDLIVSLETIEHIRDIDDFLHGIAVIADSKADIVISCPNDYWYYPGEQDGNPFHYRKYTKDDFVALVTKYLGEPTHVLLGTPVSGFCHFESGAPCGVSHANNGLKEILNSESLTDSYRIDADEDILPSNVSHFVCVWNRRKNGILPDFQAVAYPCSMNSSSPAIKDSQVVNLSDEVAALRTEIFDLNQALTNKDSQVVDLSDEVAALRTEIFDLNQALTNQKSEMRRLGLKFHASQAERETIHEALVRLQAERETIHEALVRLQAEREAMRVGYLRYMRVSRLVPSPLRSIGVKIVRFFHR